MRTLIYVVVSSLLLCAASAGVEAAESKPPADLVRLERSVSLRVAHVRDAGPVEPGPRKLYLEAQEDDAKGEQALKAGDSNAARSYFLQANDILDKLGI